MLGALCVPGWLAGGRAAGWLGKGLPLEVPHRPLGPLSGGDGSGGASSAMVKKRKGRVLIDSDTEDSGSEENLDQVRVVALPPPNWAPGLHPRFCLGRF